ncbi:MAG: hypothetical protein JXB07_11055 [Anaerolineae bacterium]|nr:hypothetical protein [Anaerolineae bacterium]
MVGVWQEYGSSMAAIACVRSADLTPTVPAYLLNDLGGNFKLIPGDQ